jgi:tetratricopeptide (TPR) repeat protein
MKKETIITAVIFLAVGFLAGYVTDNQINWSAHQKMPQAAAAQPEAPPASPPADPSAGAAPQDMPEGHPSVDDAATINEMEQLAQQSPKDSAIRLKLANYYYDQKQYDKAVDWYHRALELDPKNTNARTDLGTAYFWENRPQDAMQEYEQVLQQNPKHEQALLDAVVVNLAGTHDIDAAQKYWDRLNKVNPQNPALPSLKDQLNAARSAKP